MMQGSLGLDSSHALYVNHVAVGFVPTAFLYLSSSVSLCMFFVIYATSYEN